MIAPVARAETRGSAAASLLGEERTTNPATLAPRAAKGGTAADDGAVQVTPLTMSSPLVATVFVAEPRNCGVKPVGKVGGRGAGDCEALAPADAADPTADPGDIAVAATKTLTGDADVKPRPLCMPDDVPRFAAGQLPLRCAFGFTGVPARGTADNDPSVFALHPALKGLMASDSIVLAASDAVVLALPSSMVAAADAAATAAAA